MYKPLPDIQYLMYNYRFQTTAEAVSVEPRIIY